MTSTRDVLSSSYTNGTRMCASPGMVAAMACALRASMR